MFKNLKLPSVKGGFSVASSSPLALSKGGFTVASSTPLTLSKGGFNLSKNSVPLSKSQSFVPLMKKQGKPVSDFFQGLTSASSSIGQTIDNIVPTIETSNTVGIDNKTKNVIYIVTVGILLFAASMFFKPRKRK